MKQKPLNYNNTYMYSFFQKIVTFDNKNINKDSIENQTVYY